MAEHAGVERARRGYDAFAKGDMDTIRELLADDVVWHVAGKNPTSGDYKGKDEVFAYFARIVQETNGTLKFDVHDVLANDEHTVVLSQAMGERNGKRLDQKSASISHTNLEGKISEFWTLGEDTAAFDDFWS